MATKTEAQKLVESFPVDELPSAIESRIERDARYDRAGNYSTPLAKYNRACIRAMREQLAKI